MRVSATADRRLGLMNQVAASLMSSGDAVQPELKDALEAIAAENWSPTSICTIASATQIPTRSPWLRPGALIRTG